MPKADGGGGAGPNINGEEIGLKKPGRGPIACCGGG